MWGLWAATAWGHKAFISTKDQDFHPSKTAEAENGQCQTCPSRSTLCPPPLCTASWWPASTGASCLWLSDGLASGRRQQETGRQERAGWLPAPPPRSLPAGLSVALATLLLKALSALGWLPPSATLLAALTNSFLSCPFRPRREKRFPFYWLHIPSCPHRGKSPFGKLTCHLLSAWTLPSALGLKSPQSTENSSLTPKSLVACRESHRPLPQSWQLPSLLHSHCFAFSRMSHK